MKRYTFGGTEYASPLLAVLLDPAYERYTFGGNPILREGTTIVPMPSVTMEQRVRFVIFCALEDLTNKHFIAWAYDWLNNIDRTFKSARLWAASEYAIPGVGVKPTDLRWGVRFTPKNKEQRVAYAAAKEALEKFSSLEIGAERAIQWTA